MGALRRRARLTTLLPTALLALLGLVVSCGSGPAVLGPEDIPVRDSRAAATDARAASPDAAADVPSIEQLLEYYDMCHAAWRVRESY
ncbi:MAG: hypothetical protein EA428_12425, partial [Spirochaetaceae bacterium]